MRIIKSFLFGLFFAFSLQAQNIEYERWKDVHIIDKIQPTVIAFPDPVTLALPSPFLDLKPFNEGSESSLWKAVPRCEGECNDVSVEFVTVFGKHVTLRLKIQEGTQDHVLSLIDKPLVGSIDWVRRPLVLLARETFLKVVLNSSPLARSFEEVPENIRRLANHWQQFRNENFLIYTTSHQTLTKHDIEFIQDPQIVLVGFYDESAVFIYRRRA